MYKSKTITIYNSVNEASIEQAKESAQQNPMDRIKEVVQLILRVYSTQNKNQIQVKFILIKNEYFHRKPSEAFSKFN